MFSGLSLLGYPRDPLVSLFQIEGDHLFLVDVRVLGLDVLPFQLPVASYSLTHCHGTWRLG